LETEETPTTKKQQDQNRSQQQHELSNIRTLTTAMSGKNRSDAIHIRDAVLRIRDVHPGIRILIFVHPGSQISDPGSKNSNKREG
jgi:hypothetical protein